MNAMCFKNVVRTTSYNIETMFGEKQIELTLFGITSCEYWNPNGAMMHPECNTVISKL